MRDTRTDKVMDILPPTERLLMEVSVGEEVSAGDSDLGEASAEASEWEEAGAEASEGDFK